MKTRLIDNWITSSMGVVIFGCATYLFLTSKIDHVSYGAMITLSLTLLRAKDSLVGAEAK